MYPKYATVSTCIGNPSPSKFTARPVKVIRSFFINICLLVMYRTLVLDYVRTAHSNPIDASLLLKSKSRQKQVVTDRLN